MSNSVFKSNEDNGIAQAIKYTESGNLGASVKFAEENNEMIKYSESNMEDAINIKDELVDVNNLDIDSDDNIKLFDFDLDMLDDEDDNENTGFKKISKKSFGINEEEDADDDYQYEKSIGRLDVSNIILSSSDTENKIFKVDDEPEVSNLGIKSISESTNSSSAMPSFKDSVLMPAAKDTLSSSASTFKGIASNSDGNDDTSNAAVTRIGRMAKNTVKNGYRLGKYGVNIYKAKFSKKNSLQKSTAFNKNPLGSSNSISRKLKKVRKNIANKFKNSFLGKIFGKITAVFNKFSLLYKKIITTIISSVMSALFAIINISFTVCFVEVLLAFLCPLLYVILSLTMYLAANSATSSSTNSIMGVSIEGNVIDASSLSGEIYLPGYVETDPDVMEEVYRYITKLDAELELKILNSSASVVYVNEVATAKENVSINTDIEPIISYLYTKFGDYTLDDEVEDTIQEIHNYLYDLDNTLVLITSRLDLTVKTWDDYFYNEIFDDLTDAEKILVYSSDLFGSYKSLQYLTAPFDLDWSQYITSRHGYRVDPFTNEIAIHSGIDIGMAEGTAVRAGSAGYASVAEDPDGYGIYVTISNYNNDTEILYAHLSGAAISDGDYVSSGDVIGYVGTTGRSTGPHLHIQYYEGGKELNPLFYLNCATENAEYNDFVDNLANYEAYFSTEGVIINSDVNPSTEY